MNKEIKFEFEQLDFQTDAVNSVVDLFADSYRSLSNPLYQSSDLSRKDKQDKSTNRRNAEIIVGTNLLQNLRKVQSKAKNILIDDSFELDNGIPTFSVEMETGTGKTLVYLKTILDLHAKYKDTTGKSIFKKFIIVVPSKPIRLGIEQSVAALNDYFSKDPGYNGVQLKDHVFIFDAKDKTKAWYNKG